MADFNFGARLGEALASGGESIASGLQRRYANKSKEEENKQAIGMKMVEAGVAYDPNNPMASFEAYRKNQEESHVAERHLKSAQEALILSQALKARQESGNGMRDSVIDSSMLTPLGLPSRKNPYAGMSDKMEIRVRPSAMTAANKEVSAMDKQAETATATEADMLAARELMQGGLKTGPVQGRTISSPLVNTKGAELERIANTVIPRMRVAGSGTTSDKDMEVYRKSTLGLTQPEEVNNRVIDMTIALAQRVKDKSEYMSAYANAYGDLMGASSAWKDYIAKHPLFDDKGNVLPIIKYSDYFGGQKKEVPTGTGWSTDKEQRYQELLKKQGGK